ncbi:hypothetical protein CRUP_028698 [Coryphaenoides rupestris]|nr:hypothetical protein CRUP_028698 [Coryphaenoides rupestris]
MCISGAGGGGGLPPAPPAAGAPRPPPEVGPRCPGKVFGLQQQQQLRPTFRVRRHHHHHHHHHHQRGSSGMCHSTLAQTLGPEEAPVDRPFWSPEDPGMPLPFDLADIVSRVESLLWR